MRFQTHKGQQKRGRKKNFSRKKHFKAAITRTTPDQHHDSDVYLRSCFDDSVTSESWSSKQTPAQKTDLDGDTADDFYVVLDKPYKYSPNDVLDDIVVSKSKLLYSELKNAAKTCETGEFSCLSSSKLVRFIQTYDGDFPLVKLCVTIFEDLSVGITVHNALLPSSHEIWKSIPAKCYSVTTIVHILNEIGKYSVCVGNNDKELQNLIPVGAYLDIAGENSCSGYKESASGVSTIRSSKCDFLVKNQRCKCCQLYRRTLKKAEVRRSERTPTPQKNWLKSKQSNFKLTENQKIHKINQLKSRTIFLEREVDKLSRELKKKIREDGIQLNDLESLEMSQMMTQSEHEIEKSFPDANSFQRLFWEQQKKHVMLSNKKCMRWHPMIIKWCVYLKSKSSSAYDALRNTGFINLPSERTLYDYSNVVSKGTGFKDDVILMLQEEVNKFKDPHQKIVGILQDEIRIKSDLVYNKYTGELIGFVDLDNIGNDLLNMEESLKKESKSLAKYVLVLMVRGISTNLKFPFAHFATTGVTSDQLFSILWNGVEILEIDVGLSVLFITSDGASPNRRFIRLHQQDGAAAVYKTPNIFAEEERDLFFISDPPHLIKTTRNCFSSSFSNRNTRKLWNNGQDISWMQIVRLYEENCTGLYRICPKLTKNHVNVSAFGCMKVNLAAQVLSSSVANALEHLYPNETVETVKFIRHMNKYFDCLNTRNFKESYRKRNTNLAPYETVEDPRLAYLSGEFLDYFSSWEESVQNRRGVYTKGEKNGMMLSYQTLEGLKITTKSVVECVKYCLNRGMPFVLSERFNQDPIEQHFGIHRASVGSNTNPSVQAFDHSMQKIRMVGSQALAPVRGNTKRRLELVIDNTPLPKRPRQ